jgi:hypothetical protein
MSTILYTPIDIDYTPPAEADIVDWFEEFKMTDTTYNEYVKNRHVWATVAVRGKPKDWYNFDCFSNHWGANRRYVEGEETYFHPGFAERFPSLYNLITSLPFKQIGGVVMLKQLGPVPEHKDTADLYNPPEPAKYRVYLTDPKHNTFYLRHNGEKIFPNFDDQSRCFAFDNSAAEHGADPTNRTKILLSMTGVLDVEKHQELIARSVEKFKDKVIYS